MLTRRQARRMSQRFAGVTVAALNLLCITGLMLISLAFHEWP